jgi:hypothetical protein
VRVRGEGVEKESKRKQWDCLEKIWGGGLFTTCSKHCFSRWKNGNGERREWRERMRKNVNIP